MVIQISSNIINMTVKGGELVPTSTAGRWALLQVIKRDTFPQNLCDIYFPRLVAAGYKLAIQNYE